MTLQVQNWMYSLQALENPQALEDCTQLIETGLNLRQGRQPVQKRLLEPQVLNHPLAVLAEVEVVACCDAVSLLL